MKKLLSITIILAFIIGTFNAVPASAATELVNVAAGVRYTITSNLEDGLPHYNGACDDNIGQGYYLTDGIVRDVEELDAVGIGNMDKTLEFAGTHATHYVTLEFDGAYDLCSVVLGTVRRARNRYTNLAAIEVMAGDEWKSVDFTLEETVIEGAAQYPPYNDLTFEPHDQFFNIKASFATVNASAIRISIDTEDKLGIISYYGERGYIAQLDEISVYASVEKEPYKVGDGNNDGAVNNLDATLALKYDACLLELEDVAMEALDVNTDGKVNNLDAATILKYDAGIIDRIGPIVYLTTEEKTNYALGKTYTLTRDITETDPNYLYLSYSHGDTSWSDLELTKMTDGIVGDITDEQYAGVYAALPNTSVKLAGTNKLFEYIIDLDDYYGDIKSFVFRNVRHGIPNGNNRGFKLRLAYVSDDCVNWTKVNGTLTSEAVAGAPEINSRLEDVTNVEHFNFTYTLNEAAKGKFVRLIIVSDGGYVIQLEEIEIWNK